MAALVPAQARIVFMGSPEFAVPSLKALATEGYGLPLVVSQPDRPAGRGGRMHEPAVKVAARELGLETYQPETMRDESVHARLREARADLFVVAAYGRILPQVVLDIPRRGCLNVHASLLPRWRGASPIAAAIRAGDSVTGVSIMELVRKMDAGPVISRAEEPILAADTTGSLEPRLAELGARELVRVLPGWLAGERHAVPQDESLVTTCGVLSRHDGWLARSISATDAERLVRAYNPWPGVSVGYREERLAIWRAHVGPGDAAEPGTTAIIGKHPAIALADGWLFLDEVQRPGGKRLSGQQFIAGERGQLAPQVGLE
ncbi:MAG TPA: methionyl-tRNA formyltransferase [Tepidiformaceae bacterium]|nr:methionyl-tRNA formyltransferase [Tepidiformaceae bacterium]